MDNIKILIVDDEVDALNAIKIGLQDNNYQLFTATSKHQALDIINRESIDIAVTDLKLKDGTGLDILNYIQKNCPQISVIIMTAYGTVDTAIQAIRGGAYDYLQKPFRMADLTRLIDRLSENIRLRKENENLRRRLDSAFPALQLVGNSSAFRHILELVKQIAPAQSTVLITGESGTGKELIANAIHYYSGRRDKPFVTINCGAIPENLMEAEIFGYEKGAFTGALKQKKGRIELAHEGTLFLDEIGDLPRPLQVKLLRVLQNGEFERLGGTATLSVNVRVIAATNTDLESQVKEGTFREDLYYRLNVISIHMPPLRERTEDIPLLVQHFIEKYNKRNNKNIEGIDPLVLEAMMQYPWKGNVRELENMIERAVVLSQEKILRPHHFPMINENLTGALTNMGMEIGMSLSEIEKKAIQKTLQYHNYDKNKTAATLQIGLATLYRKIKEYGIKEKY
ncbi:MAG: sigma-54 dependent transcriptional regulator [Calditrichia bacterium]